MERKARNNIDGRTCGRRAHSIEPRGEPVQLAVNAVHQTFLGDGITVPGVVKKSRDVAHVLSIMLQDGEADHRNKSMTRISGC